MKGTESMIVEAFSQLLDEKPFHKITVKDIVDRCGVNRNTFYYHFHDIPSLCERTWMEKTDLLIAEHFRLGSADDCLSLVVEYFMEHRNAVYHVYRSLPRDVFLRELDRLFLYQAKAYVNKIAVELGLSEQEQELLTRYQKCKLVGTFLDWLDSDMSYDPRESLSAARQLQHRLLEAGYLLIP